MNKIALTVLFSIFCLSLVAQTGIYGLSYGQSMEDAEKTLKAAGFTVSERLTDKIIFAAEKIPSLKKLIVNKTSEGNNVYSWFAYYDTNALDEDAAVEMVENINGSYDIYDDYDYVYIWDIGNDKAIYVFENYEDETVIEYSIWDSYYDDWWDYWW